MRIYLAGPMRGVKMCNFPAFFRAARLLEEAGHDVVNPAAHDMEMGFDPARGNYGETPELGLDRLLAWDFAQIVRCDAIVVLPGWRESRGTRAELVVAHYAGLKVMAMEFEPYSVTPLLVVEPDIRWTII